jgi:hypothetical protein
MKKEVFIAVVIGLVLGLFITYGLYTARQALIQPPAISTIPGIDETQPAQDTSSLIITSPTDETVTTEKEITVVGSTLAKSFLIIFVNDTETITTADETGNFSVNVQLDPGGNIISVHSLDENGRESIAERAVVYLTPELEATPTSTNSAQTATKSAKTTR